MKTKKLIAILTIVALMMGLVPMAAFADDDATDNYSAAATQVFTDKETVAIGEDVNFTLIVRTANGSIVTGEEVTFYVKSSSDAITVKLGDAEQQDGNVATGNGIKITTTPDDEGIVNFSVSSSVAGVATITLYKGTGTDALAIGGAQGVKKLTFTASEADKVVTLTASSKYNPDLNEEGKTQAGFDLVLEATVKDKNHNFVNNQEVLFQKEISTDKYETIGKATTNLFGKAYFDASESVAGNYKFRAVVGNAKSEAYNVDVKAGAPASITAVSSSSYAELKASWDEGEGVPVIFNIKDAFGNNLNDESYKGINHASYLTAVVYSAPEGSKLEKESYGPDPLWTPNKQISIVGNNLVFNLPADKAGAYTIIGSVTGTGLTAIATINVGDFGTAQKLELTAPASMKHVQEDKTVEASLVDENGIKQEITDPDGKVVFSSSDVTLVEVDKEGALKVASETARGVVTITATHLTTGLTASVDIAVVGNPVNIVATPKVTGKVAEITMQLTDAQGNKTFYDDDGVEFNVIAPDLTITKEVAFNSAGVGTFTATATDVGPKSVTVVTNKGLTQTFTINFATLGSDIPGAANINMYIGAKGFFADGEAVSCDVAPFIGEGNRTFVELRNLANAMGVDNDDITYENGVITLNRIDMTLVLTIGSNTIQKTVDGVSTTITADVAPYVIAEAGRTVLPLRAVGEAFGYTVNYADGLITISK